MASKKTNNKKMSSTMAAAVQRIYGRSAPILICESLLFVAAAALLVFRPVAFLTALTFVVGIGLIVFGLYRMIAGFVVSHNIGGGGMDVVFGLLNIVLGVLFCIYPVGSVISLVYIFVALFLFKALGALIFAIDMARVKFGHYVFDIIMAIILVALAVLLFVYPMAGAVAVVYYLAITLLLYAASNIYMFIELLRLKRIARK